METPRLETSELVKSFAESIKETTNLHKAQSPVKQSNHPPATAPPHTLERFNINQLPANAQQRCDTKTRGELLCQNKMKPVRTDTPEVRNPSKMRAMHCCLNPPVTGNRLITRDGAVFHLCDHGPKSDQMVITSAPRCEGNKPEETQSWCMVFTEFAAAEGKCVHPCFCFRKDNMTSHTGFTFGDNDNMNQCNPTGKCAPSTKTWSHLIHNAITQKNVFPAGTCNEQIKMLQSLTGNSGCEELSAAIQPDHHNCHSHPAALTKAPPNQLKSESIQGCFN